MNPVLAENMFEIISSVWEKFPVFFNNYFNVWAGILFLLATWGMIMFILKVVKNATIGRYQPM